MKKRRKLNGFGGFSWLFFFWWVMGWLASQGLRQKEKTKPRREANKFNSTKQMYISLWKEIYNIKLSNNSTNIDNFKQYIHNKNIIHKCGFHHNCMHSGIMLRSRIEAGFYTTRAILCPCSQPVPPLPPAGDKKTKKFGSPDLQLP